MSITSSAARCALVGVAALSLSACQKPLPHPTPVASTAPLAASAPSPVVTPAQAANRRVTIINSTSHFMTNLYASNTDDANYHGDLLGSDILRPGETKVINFDDGTGACYFDLKAKFTGDNSAEKSALNVCTQASWEITEN
jgi:hypothetical protein